MLLIPLSQRLITQLALADTRIKVSSKAVCSMFSAFVTIVSIYFDSALIRRCSSNIVRLSRPLSVVCIFVLFVVMVSYNGIPNSSPIIIIADIVTTIASVANTYAISLRIDFITFIPLRV